MGKKKKTALPAVEATANAGVTLVWFRQDLRLEDNPALAAALRSGGVVIPVFIGSPEEEGIWAPGAASRWWLHHALADLAKQFQARGSRVLFRFGPTVAAMVKLVRDTGATQVMWNRRHEPRARAMEIEVATALGAMGVRTESFNGNYLHAPGEILGAEGKPLQVFGAFWRRCMEKDMALPVKMPRVRKDQFTMAQGVESWPVKEFQLLPPKGKTWDREFYKVWKPTLAGARARLRKFVGEGLAGYREGRDVPAVDGTSQLSPYLHWGQLSARQVFAAITEKGKGSAAAAKFLTELGWREFAGHLLHHFPQTPETPLRAEWATFPWEENPAMLRAWQRGQTGYPLVDAGLRQLWRTGWMHNRVRMVAASFLVKQLMQPWRCGAAWFWDTLVDADLANNTLGWQWVAGCGADAAPYFRVFNPVRQGERFDPAGKYVRAFVPELAKLPDPFIHAPWTAPEKVLRAAEVTLGVNYPRPVVEPAVGRRRALDFYGKWRAWRK